MKTVEFTEDHIGPMVARMRLREREALDHTGGVEGFREMMLKLKDLPSCSMFTIMASDDTVAAIAGMNRKWAGVAEFWVFTTHMVEKEPVGFMRESRWIFNELFDSFGLRRAESTVAISFEDSIKWLTWLGFEKEGLLRDYGVDGEDHFMMSRIL